MCYTHKRDTHQPSISGYESAHQQGSCHPADSKDRHSEGVQHSEKVVIWNPVIAFNNGLIVEVSDVLEEEEKFTW